MISRLSRSRFSRDAAPVEQLVDGATEPLQATGAERHAGRTPRRETAARELILDHPVHLLERVECLEQRRVDASERVVPGVALFGVPPCPLAQFIGIRRRLQEARRGVDSCSYRPRIDQ